jgi:hypothetical protein
MSVVATTASIPMKEDAEIGVKTASGCSCIEIETQQVTIDGICTTTHR